MSVVGINASWIEYFLLISTRILFPCGKWSSSINKMVNSSPFIPKKPHCWPSISIKYNLIFISLKKRGTAIEVSFNEVNAILSHVFIPYSRSKGKSDLAGLISFFRDWTSICNRPIRSLGTLGFTCEPSKIPEKKKPHYSEIWSTSNKPGPFLEITRIPQ